MKIKCTYLLLKFGKLWSVWHCYVKHSVIRNATYVKINQQYIQKADIVQCPLYVGTVNRGSCEITIVCLTFTPLVDLFNNFLRSVLLVFHGFFHSSIFLRCQWIQDQQLTVSIVESHKLSRMFCITKDYNCKKTRQLKSNKSL